MKKRNGYRPDNYIRHPRTTQEIRANQDYPSLVRPKRRNLPTSYDDLQVCRDRSWKAKGRKTQYRSESNYAWHEVEIGWYGNHIMNRQVSGRLYDAIWQEGCYSEHFRKVDETEIIGYAYWFRWYGPDFLNDGEQ